MEAGEEEHLITTNHQQINQMSVCVCLVVSFLFAVSHTDHMGTVCEQEASLELH